MHPQGVYYLVHQHRKRQEELRIKQRHSVENNTYGDPTSLSETRAQKEDIIDTPPPLIRQTAVIPNDKMTPRKNPVIQRKSQLYPAAKALFNQRRRPSIEEKPELSSAVPEEEDT
jgi:hypothetical protein